MPPVRCAGRSFVPRVGGPKFGLVAVACHRSRSVSWMAFDRSDPTRPTRYACFCGGRDRVDFFSGIFSELQCKANATGFRRHRSHLQIDTTPMRSAEPRWDRERAVRRTLLCPGSACSNASNRVRFSVDAMPLSDGELNTHTLAIPRSFRVVFGRSRVGIGDPDALNRVRR